MDHDARLALQASWHAAWAEARARSAAARAAQAPEPPRPMRRAPLASLWAAASRWLRGGALCALALPALEALAPETSPRPEPRPVVEGR